MIAEVILEKFIRDLGQLKEEISLYKNEGDMWLIKGDIKNSSGNLASYWQPKTLLLVQRLERRVTCVIEIMNLRIRTFQKRSCSPK